MEANRRKEEASKPDQCPSSMTAPLSYRDNSEGRLPPRLNEARVAGNISLNYNLHMEILSSQ